MMSRPGQFFLCVAMVVALGSALSVPALAQGFGGKNKSPAVVTNDKIVKARDKAIRAYDFQTEFPGASDKERNIARAEPMKVPEAKEIKEAKPSPFWITLGRILEPIFKILGWALLTAIVLALIYYAASISGGWRSRKEEEVSDAMQPLSFDRTDLKDWLQEAEALAAQGRYSEAVHFLLFSSFDNIRRRLNTVLRPAWTSREILREVPMRDSAQTALSLLVTTVEQSEFGGRAIDADDFHRCRDTYVRFVAEVAA